MKANLSQVMVLATVLFAAVSLPSFAVESAGEVSPVFQTTSGSAPGSDFDLEQWREALPLGTSYSQFDLNRKMTFGIQADQETGEIETVAVQDDDSAMVELNKKNPGRALLLSAILPGAGELYAGKPWRAAGFFALEIASWVGAVYYANEGEDVETRYEAFADANWVENIYRTLEYEAAVDPTVGTAGEGYDGERSEWETLGWNDKIRYLPTNFTHELPDVHNQQYYENVGKYLTQFGFGWNDAFGDNPNTAYLWDGESPRARQYIDMRAESNDLLDKSSLFFAVVMVNHVASALHAGFTVRAMNKDMEVEPQMGNIWHNREPVTTAGLRVRF